jgi:hypothetical protein
VGCRRGRRLAALAANGRKPRLLRGFKVSRDPKFAGKLEDIAGLYGSAPEHTDAVT